MNDKTYRVLEYDKIIGLLSQEAASEMTRQVIAGSRPSVDLPEIRETLAETTEAVSVIVNKGPLPLGGFYDIAGHLHLAGVGGTLSMKQLLEVLYNMQSARNAQQFVRGDLPPIDRIQGITSILFVRKPLEEHIDRCILSEDEMADSASPTLRDIRRNIARQNESIRSKMNSILSSSENKTILQDSIFTIRQGRYVVPVKQEHRTKVKGIIHDQSSTGATLFIEPQAIVTLNNELRELELKEKIEIQRILAELSAEVAESEEELRNNQKLLVQLDLIFARGRLSVKMKGNPAEINDQGYLRIRNGRHPLIDKNQVVPIQIAIGRDYSTLVITGPNTGGKTVTLKTVGLFVMMTQTGLHIPADPGSEIPVLRQIFADIGDEQSIEQSLSTFSSHMTNIVQIVRDADQDTMVLLDELGAGTDPAEGAALAIAILNELISRGVTTLATTHYTELKKYAIATSGVENASMEFNVETLSPTYRLIIGTPGKSNAFEIASKLGLSGEIIQQARSLLGSEEIQFEDVIATIEKDRKAAEAQRDEAILLNLEMRKKKEELDRQAERLAAQKEKILSNAKEEARDLVKEAKTFFDEVQKELKELEQERESTNRNRKQEEIRKRVREASGKYREELVIEKTSTPARAEELKLGDRVKIVHLDQKGSLLTLPDEKNEVTVLVGAMKLTVNLEHIMKIQEGGGKSQQKKSRYGSLYQGKAMEISPSINVIGKQLSEAEFLVDKYLDDCYMAGLKEVQIIHGRGEGILRSGLAQLMKQHNHVEKYRKGSYHEGGDGVTVVTLK